MTTQGQALRAATTFVRQAWAKTVGRLLSLLFIGLIRGYQRFISPLTPPSCRYHPSCSAYAIAAVRVHGPIKGLALAGWRLLRCNPWSRGGIDFPPARGGWRGDHQVRPTVVAGSPSGSAPEAARQGHSDSIDAVQAAQVVAHSHHRE